MQVLNRFFSLPQGLPGLGVWLGLVLTVAAASSTHAVEFTGDAAADFAHACHIVSDGESPDVGMPSNLHGLGRISGFDVKVLYFDYDLDTDTASFGLDFFGIAGDADGDGDPNGTSIELSNIHGDDTPDWSQSEGVAVVFDVAGLADGNRDGVGDFAVGVPAGNSDSGAPLECADTTPSFSMSACFGIYDYDDHAGIDPPTHSFTNQREEEVWLSHTPSSVRPDLEFAIPRWSQLLTAFGASSSDLHDWNIGVKVFVGSFQDAGIGEEFIPDPRLGFVALSSELCLCEENPELELCLCQENPELCSCQEEVDDLGTQLTAANSSLDACKKNLESVKSQVESLTSENSALVAENQQLHSMVADDDGDGVYNDFDTCPETEAEAAVDATGCSLPQFCEAIDIHCPQRQMDLLEQRLDGR